MNIYEVRDNLIRTIEGKQAMLDGLRVSEKEGYYIIKQWLEINIDELTKILKDVTICCVQETEKSWIGVDRQGGI